MVRGLWEHLLSATFIAGRLPPLLSGTPLKNKPFPSALA
ncbi:hypothetical protein SD77_2417 [Bacillus badius]|uniref:Uncharacterized protein n=1 Tax=Bacillus badius TaxID=1455 RepID=A0ABR5AZ03_BACBA|nr:hypothetical protein SD78_2124 [Bacillus badius]KIL79963.1 hypothetical protein SD77_2417 [Bacillus badius]